MIGGFVDSIRPSVKMSEIRAVCQQANADDELHDAASHDHINTGGVQNTNYDC